MASIFGNKTSSSGEIPGITSNTTNENIVLNSGNTTVRTQLIVQSTIQSTGNISSSGSVYTNGNVKLPTLQEVHNYINSTEHYERFTFSYSGTAYNGTLGALRPHAAWRCIKSGNQYSYTSSIPSLTVEYKGWDTQLSCLTYPKAKIISTSFFNVDLDSSGEQFIGWQSSIYANRSYASTTEYAAHTGTDSWIICPNIPDDSETSNDIIFDIVVCFSQFGDGWSGEPLQAIPLNGQIYYTQRRPYNAP